MATQDWQLNLMKRMKFLRKLLPGWHAREKAFRNWYMDLAKQFHYENRAAYEAYVRALEVPEEVSGYREVRYPKMEAARQKAEAYLKGGEPPGKKNEEPAYFVS